MVLIKDWLRPSTLPLSSFTRDLTEKVLSFSRDHFFFSSLLFRLTFERGLKSSAHSKFLGPLGFFWILGPNLHFLKTSIWRCRKSATLKSLGNSPLSGLLASNLSFQNFILSPLPTNLFHKSAFLQHFTIKIQGPLNLWPPFGDGTRSALDSLYLQAINCLHNAASSLVNLEPHFWFHK